MTTPTASIGIALRDLDPEPATVESLVEGLAAAGLPLVHVPSVTWFSPTLDSAELDDAAAVLAERHIEVGVGLGAVNSGDPARAAHARRLGDGDLELGWRRLIAASARLGAGSLHFTVGVTEDRFDRTVTWAERLVSSALLLRTLAPVAADHGLPLVLKTHEEMTTFEIVRLLDDVGSEALLVGYSPVNVLARLEDPFEAAVRIAAHVHTLFLDDASIHWTATGLTRQMQPVGEGSIPWPALHALFSGAVRRPPVVLDLHRAALDMPFYTPGWTAEHPDLTTAELLKVSGTARQEPGIEVGLAERRATGIRALLDLRDVRPLSAAARPSYGLEVAV